MRAQSIGRRGYVDVSEISRQIDAVPVTANESPIPVTQGVQSPQSEFAESYARMTSQHVPASV